MCADLVLSYRQNKIIWGFAAIFSFILEIPKHHLLVRQVQYHKFSEKWKAIKRELYVAFISKNIILRESLTVREGKMVTSNGR